MGSDYALWSLHVQHQHRRDGDELQYSLLELLYLSVWSIGHGGRRQVFNGRHLRDLEEWPRQDKVCGGWNWIGRHRFDYLRQHVFRRSDHIDHRHVGAWTSYAGFTFFYGSERWDDRKRNLYD